MLAPKSHFEAHLGATTSGKITCYDVVVDNCPILDKDRIEEAVKKDNKHTLDKRRRGLPKHYARNK